VKILPFRPFQIAAVVEHMRRLEFYDVKLQDYTVKLTALNADTILVSGARKASERLRSGSDQHRRVAAPNNGPRLNGQSNLPGLCQVRFEGIGTHVAGGFGKKKFSTGFKSAVNIGEQRRGVRHFVNHRERQREINFARGVIDAETISFRQAGINPVGQPGLRRAPGQSVQHFWLHINGDHSAFGPDASCQFKREESHPRSGFEDGGSLGNKRADDCAWVVHPPTQRDHQKIAEPPGTDSMRHEAKLSMRDWPSRRSMATAGFGPGHQ
jgi:hypothetical protein